MVKKQTITYLFQRKWRELCSTCAASYAPTRYPFDRTEALTNELLSQRGYYSKGGCEWVVLDTFDMFSPMHDHPQRIKKVAQMFQRHGANVTFAGFETYSSGFAVAVVRGVKKVNPA